MVAEPPQQPQAAGELIAVGQAKSASASLVTADVEGIKKLATQTRAIGIILPPPDIRAIVDKTAQFVAKNGTAFEERIMGQQQANQKFNFIQPTDPYHPYYRMRVKHFEDVEKGEVAPDAAPTAAAVEAAKEAQAAQPAAAATPAVPTTTTRPLEKPDDEVYTVHVPEGLTTLDLDVIKLTAQFVARNGAAFLTGLASREPTNPQFHFLKPNSSLFGFFSKMADAYSAVLMPSKDLRGKLAADGGDRAAILERCLKRLEWERVRDAKAAEEEEERERERIAMLQIDWHEFAVVETIDFYDDEDEELPPPLSLKEVLVLSRQAADAALTAGGDEDGMQADGAAAAAAGGGAGQLDDEERALVAQAAAEAGGRPPGGAPPLMPPPGAPPPLMPPPGGPPPYHEDHDQDMDMEVDEQEAPLQPPGQPPEPEEEEEEEAPIKVVRNYQRPVQRPGMPAYDPTKYAVSPITGELVPLVEMAEHMRISLIDPRWKEQRDAMLSKLKDTTKAGDDEISRNLLSLARTRPDIFGSTDEEVSQAVSAAVKEKETSGQGRAVAWDGQTQGGKDLSNQMKQIQENRAEISKPPELAKPKTTFGPAGGPPPGGAAAAAGAGGGPPRQQLPLPPPPTLPPPLQRPPASNPLPPPPMMPPRPFGGPPPMRPPMPPMGMGGPMGGRGHPMSGMGPPGGLPGPPGMMGGPMGGGGRPPPPGGEDGPDAKRPRLDFVLQPEEEFLEQVPGPSKVRVQCPELEGYPKVQGQLLEVEVATLRNSVGDFKQRLSDVLDLPASKQNLSRPEVGFMRNELSLAHYNVGPDVVLTLGIRERGGRKK